MSCDNPSQKLAAERYVAPSTTKASKPAQPAVATEATSRSVVAAVEAAADASSSASAKGSGKGGGIGEVGAARRTSRG